MGPFKHTVDDGLDVRKAAFECMYSLLESCLGQLDICEFLNHVEDGLKDHYDIRMLTFIMLARLATLCPAPVLQRVDRLIEPLRATCTTKGEVLPDMSVPRVQRSDRADGLMEAAGVGIEPGMPRKRPGITFE
ncbi:cullin-associated NEDD8-dissociated protein 2-like [Choloepus didactylus]|uniref:cullin-associated NEDD8-dissociated protein 2-like n=1 Tax=Choloepus didactylus TaxID=27675 RepID=UPI00189EFA94|nr:cullin-associated NEDD8-dissociated protein 2-like [Choloepus didactylus]